jgi:hypothetical protein
MSFRISFIVTTLAITACGQSVAPNTLSRAAGEELVVLSNRADLVSGNDVLVALAEPAAAGSTISFSANGQPVPSIGGLDSSGRYVALVSELPLGAVTLSSSTGGSTQLIMHPNGGPVFSGPQLQPWGCQEGAVDAQCNQPVQYTFLYKPTNGSGLQPYDPENPPDDVDETTTQTGQTVPFIVRQELGYQARDQYVISMLWQPDQPWTPWAPQPQWNGKLLITHGGSCGTGRSAGQAPDTGDVMALGLGFAVASTALDNLGHNCNVVTAAESLVMMKERLIEQYGALRYTIGTGCSGGAITQLMVSNAYPGVYQGNITACTYPDVFSTGAQFADLHALRLYFENPLSWGAGVVWEPNQMALVEGHIAHVNAITTDELFFKNVTNPVGTCAGPASYHPETNPGGVRCGLLDYLINQSGPRDPSVWSPMEVAAGKGFGGNPIDNVGIQYGLSALQQGLILPSQFVDLNEKIGGFDIDIRKQAERTKADSPALANAYRSGELNQANNLNRVAIINSTGPDPGAAHDTVHAFWVRRRLDREHGNHDNHIMWAGPVVLFGDLTYTDRSLLAMDRWLGAVEADRSDLPLPEKLTKNKPADIQDECLSGTGQAIAGPECVELVEPLIAYSSPRFVAGAPGTDDVLKCQLKPFSRNDDYGLIPFTEAEWTRLEAVFRDGVCDYSQPGVDQQGAVAWMQYGDATTHVYGGQPLPPAPQGSGAGWASPAFGIFR